MFLLFYGQRQSATLLFATALTCLLVSLLLSLIEIYISINALNIELNDLEKKEEQ
jgi:hypothetical protein